MWENACTVPHLKCDARDDFDWILLFLIRNKKYQMSVSRVSLVTLNCCVCACVCVWRCLWAVPAGMWTSPLRLAALDLWDSHPAHRVCHVPPFETLMDPAECVTEWVGDNGAGPAASCVLRLPPVPRASKHQGKTTLYMSCSRIVRSDLMSYSPVILFTRSCRIRKVAPLLLGWQTASGCVHFSFGCWSPEWLAYDN